MNGSALLPDESALRLLIEVPTNPAMIWRVPPNGLVLGSALGCDIRLPSEFPPVVLTVFPVREGPELSARIRPLAPLLDIRHRGKEWQGEILAAGEKIQIGGLVLGVLNAATQKLQPAIAQGENWPPSHPALSHDSASKPTQLTPETTKPKKKVSWLRRWQRSLEMRESTLMATQNWGPPPVAPVVQAQTFAPPSTAPLSPESNQAAPGDPRWRELEEWIQTARDQAEACARERARLEELQSHLARHDEQIRKGQADLESAWSQFHQADRITRGEWHEGLENLELARKAIAAQAESLEAYRLQLETEHKRNLEYPPIQDTPFQPEVPAALSPLLEARATHAAPEPQPVQWIQPPDAPVSLDFFPDASEVNAQIASLWNQLAANQTPLPETKLTGLPLPAGLMGADQLAEPDSGLVIASPENELSESAGPSEFPAPIHSSGNEPSESVYESIEGLEETTEEEPGEDLENFLPPPSELELEAFRHWCQERLESAAGNAEDDSGLSAPGDPPGENKSHRHGFARKLLEQGIATPNLLAPFTRLANRRGVALEDILTRLNIFTSHQIATMALGCANDLVLGRWYILDLPGADNSDLDRELVFRVFDPKSNMPRVLRILAPGEARNQAKAADYRTRHEACARLDSEHLIANLEVTELNGLPCVLQEEWTGTTFESWPSMGGSATVWYRLFLQAAIALRDLHQAGLHHGFLATSHFLLKNEGLLRLTGHATPLWLTTQAEKEDRGPTGDIADLARIGHTWWAGPNGENQRLLPESLAGVLARMEQDHPEAITTSKALAEELDRAGILLPSGAAAWKRFLDEFSGPESSNEEADEEGPEDGSGSFRRTA